MKLSEKYAWCLLGLVLEEAFHNVAHGSEKEGLVEEEVNVHTNQNDLVQRLFSTPNREACLAARRHTTTI